MPTPFAEEPLTKVTCHLPYKDITELRQYASRIGRPWSEVLREILKAWLKEKRRAIQPPGSVQGVVDRKGPKVT